MFSHPNNELNPNELKLAKAAAGGRLEEVKQLIQEGVEVNFKPSTAKTQPPKTTPLIEAAKNLRRDVVLFLLDEAEAEVDATNAAEETALMAVFGYLPFYAEFPMDPLANGVSQDKKQPMTAAEEALLKDCLDMAQLLIDHGAQINFCEREGLSILNKALYRYYYQPRNGFLTQDEIYKISVSYHNLPFIKFLLENGANVNFVDKGGNTPAMHLVRNIDEETLPILRLMIAHGMNVNALNKTQQSVLFIAAQGSGPKTCEVVKCLIEAGADRSALYTTQKTDLMYAIQWEDENDFLLQLQTNAKVLNAQDADGETALIKAVKTNQYKLISRLIAAGANPNFANKKNQTALLLADATSIDLLMTAGASLKKCGVALLHMLISGATLPVDKFKFILSKLSIEQINSPLFQMTALYIAVSAAAFNAKLGTYRQQKRDFGYAIIPLLLEAGADPTIEYRRIPSDKGVKPFDDCVIEGNEVLKAIYANYQLQKKIAQPAAALSASHFISEEHEEKVTSARPRP